MADKTNRTYAFCSDHFGLGELGAYSNDRASAITTPVSMSTTIDFAFLILTSHPMTHITVGIIAGYQRRFIASSGVNEIYGRRA
jgi:hypothetical protein